MFVQQIVSVAEVAIPHHEFHTVDYLLKELYAWFDSLDLDTAYNAATIAHLLIIEIDKDISVRQKYYADVFVIHYYMEKTLEYFKNK